MIGFGALSRSHRLLRLAALALVTTGIAGCSGESTRWSGTYIDPYGNPYVNPYGNPYATNGAARNEITGSVTGAPPSRVETQPLPQPQAVPSLPPPAAGERPVPMSANTGSSGGAQGMGSFRPAPAPPAAVTPAAYSDVTGGVGNARPVQSKWNWDGGTAIIVGPGETVETLSRKYGVPFNAIMQANNMTSPVIQPGQRVVIPRFNATETPTAAAAGHAAAGRMAAAPTSTVVAGGAPAPPAKAVAPLVAAPGSHVHIVAPGETLTSIAHRYHQPVTAIAAANRIAPHRQLKMGDRITIPGPTSPSPAPAATKPAAAPAVATRPAAPVAAQKVSSTESQPSVRVATSAPDTGNEASAATGEPIGAAPSFRWPVRGRVITAFGAKTNGQQNDGINLAVPEGTAVRAADDGVVAYAGNELKGYGNLILLRHANGFVTAYAHASEINVKRGDQVRRGQVIAKSGQTGTVTSPQLHFEIRKGSSPIDPMQFLPGA